MSRDSAKAHYSKQPGDPDEGYITASDAQAAIDDIYDDMAGLAVIADGSVTTAKIASDAVTSAQIAANAVGSSELADNAVNVAALDADYLGNGLVLTADSGEPSGMKWSALPAPIGDIDGIGIPTLPSATTPTNLASAGQAFDGGSIADWSGAAGALNNAATISAVTGPDGDAMLVECAGSAILEGCHTTLAGLTSGHTYTVALRVARVSGKATPKLTAYANGSSVQSWVTLSGTTQMVMACVFVATGTTANFAVSIESAAGQATSFRVDAFGYWEGAGGDIPDYNTNTITGMTAAESGVIGVDGSHMQYQDTSYTSQHYQFRSAAGAVVAMGADDLHTAQLSSVGTVGGNHGVGSTVLVPGFAVWPTRTDAVSRTWQWDDTPATQVQTWTYRADSPGVVYVDTTWTFHDDDTLNIVQSQVAAPNSPTFAVVGAAQSSPFVSWGAVASPVYVTPDDFAGGVAPTCFMAKGADGSSAVIELGDRALEGTGEAGYLSTVKSYIFAQRLTTVADGTIINSRAAHSFSPHTHDRALHVVRDGAVVRWWLMAGSTGSTTHPSLPLYEGAVVLQTRGTAAVTTEVVSGAITVTGAGWAEGVIRTDIA